MMKKRNIYEMHFCTNLENKMVFLNSVLDFYLINKTFKEEKLKNSNEKSFFYICNECMQTQEKHIMTEM